jgi:hypothetical protein
MIPSTDIKVSQETLYQAMEHQVNETLLLTLIPRCSTEISSAILCCAITHHYSIQTVCALLNKGCRVSFIEVEAARLVGNYAIAQELLKHYQEPNAHQKDLAHRFFKATSWIAV